MSNAMRNGKRALAGVAAGALGLALIPFVGVGVSQAAGTPIDPEDAFSAGPLEAVSAAIGVPVTEVFDASFLGLLDGSQLNGGNGSDGAGVAAAPILASVSRTGSGAFTLDTDAGVYQVPVVGGVNPGEPGYVSGTPGALVDVGPVTAGAVAQTFAIVPDDGGNAWTDTTGGLSEVVLTGAGAGTLTFTVWADSNLSGTLDGNEVNVSNSITFVPVTSVATSVAVSPSVYLAGSDVTAAITMTAGGLPFFLQDQSAVATAPVVVLEASANGAAWTTVDNAGVGTGLPNDAANAAAEVTGSTAYAYTMVGAPPATSYWRGVIYADPADLPALGAASAADVTTDSISGPAVATLSGAEVADSATWAWDVTGGLATAASTASDVDLLAPNTSSTFSVTPTFLDAFESPVANGPVRYEVTVTAPGVTSFTVNGVTRTSGTVYAAATNSSGELPLNIVLNGTVANGNTVLVEVYDGDGNLLGDTWLATFSTVLPQAAAVTVSSTLSTLTASTYPSTDVTVTAGQQGTVVAAVTNAQSAALAGLPVTVTAPSGVRIRAGAPVAGASVSSFVTRPLVLTTAGGTGAVQFSAISANSGTFPIVLSVGGVTTTANVTFTAGAPDSVSIAPTGGGSVPSAVDAFSATSMTATLLDANSNPVVGSQVQVNVAGDATIAGTGGQSIVLATTASGQVTFSVLAGESGSFTVSATSLVDPTVTTATPSIAITPLVFESILITDSGRENRRIFVSGETEGFDMGAILKPWIRFPGQVGFSMGDANIEVANDGSFSWGRNTGKKTAVQIRDLGDTLRSNTVIIAAR